MPGFEKSPPALVDRFHELAALVPDATERQMFGYPTCVLDGNMFMGLHEESFILRLGEADRATFRADFEAELFEPMPGRPMKEYVVVPPSLLDGPEIERWVARSYQYAGTLPPKAAKRPKATKARSTRSG